MSYRWTVRLPEDSPILDMLHEVQDTSNLSMGQMLELAVSQWFESLPEEDEEEPEMPTSALVLQYSTEPQATLGTPDTPTSNQEEMTHAAT